MCCAHDLFYYLRALFNPQHLSAIFRVARAHFEKRLRQGRATIVGRLRQLCETPFDGSGHTWPRNDAGQLVCVFFRLVVKFEAARARNRFFSVEFLDVAVPIEFP